MSIIDYKYTCTPKLEGFWGEKKIPPKINKKKVQANRVQCEVHTMRKRYDYRTRFLVPPCIECKGNKEVVDKKLKYPET